MVSWIFYTNIKHTLFNRLLAYKLILVLGSLRFINEEVNVEGIKNHQAHANTKGAIETELFKNNRREEVTDGVSCDERDIQDGNPAIGKIF